MPKEDVIFSRFCDRIVVSDELKGEEDTEVSDEDANS